jgi:monolysocardiolipin acyltransferase
MTEHEPKSLVSTEQALRHWRPEPHWYKNVLCALVVNTSRFVMRVMNRVEFEGVERWEALFGERTRGLLSFSNHVSLFDDPLLTSNLGETRYSAVRWIPADHINFFGSNLKGFIYSAGKCVPIIRGGGLDQPGFSFLLDRLGEGDWVHMFPEGGRTRDPEGRLRSPFKRGIGRLMAQAHPTVMPFYHYGMHRVLPIGRAFPRWGKRVQVHFGEPTIVDDAFLAGHRHETGDDTPALWQALADWSYTALQSLELQVHPNQPKNENIPQPP